MNFKSLISKIIPLSISSVIYLDEANQKIRFYYKDKDNLGKYIYAEESFCHNLFEKDFITSFANIVRIHFDKKSFGRTAIILPDSWFFTDTIKLPLIQRKAMKASLRFAFNTIYKNFKELRYMSYSLHKDKKNVVYAIVGAKKVVFERIFASLTQAGVDIAGITYATHAIVDKAISLNSKIKSGSSIVVDVKENCTTFGLVVNGKNISYFNLPFGYACFSDSVMYREESYYDHSSSELLVLNAKEKAKNKKLTTYDAEQEVTEDVSVEDVEKTVIVSDDEIGVDQTIAFGNKKIKLKKLPQYMLRHMPDTSEGFIYENFRPIVKWALELARGNQDLFVNGVPKNVFINLPNKFNCVFDKIKEEGGSKINFIPVSTAESDSEQKANLAIYGGLLMGKHSRYNVF